MASVTIRNIDESVKRKLKIRAARHGRSMEEELRQVVYRLADEVESDARDPEEADRIYWRIRALAFPAGPEPFDQKAFTDGMYDYLP